MKREIFVGTRQSRLAMWQANWVVERLRELKPDYSYRIVGIKTRGDNILDVALAKIGDKGLFTKELELAMLQGRIDLAVHSMKDLPTELPGGLTIGAVCRREFPGDVLVSRSGKKIDELPAGAVIGTSSLRRRAQLLHFRNDLKTVDVRGNVHTRLRKLEEGNMDATVLAFAGLHRLGLDSRITQVLPFSVCLPAVGQGSVGVEVREGDEEVLRLVAAIDHPESRAAVTAERAMLKKLEGGCQIPIGALGVVDGTELRLEGIVAGPDGRQLVRASVAGPVGKAEELGENLAGELIKLGAGELLWKLRRESQ
ncbi:MAG: hydroxymethylbilane synthase [Firmicutes bacterium]|nr:hydroxymethylbilane synthase [Bacillota bacterium]